MNKKWNLVSMLVLAWSVTAIAQSTMVGIKIGNNGNISLTQKFKTGNYSQMYSFGNGYQAGVEIRQKLYGILGVKAEAGYMNSYYEIDHDSHMPSNTERNSHRIYEEIAVNSSSFGISTSAIIQLGWFRLGIGPDLALIHQSTGKGLRFVDGSYSEEDKPYQVQYRFYSSRKQVFNLKDEKEVHAYEVNRIVYGVNFNANIDVFKSFSIELKAIYPLSEFIDGFVIFDNNAINQKSINAQLSVMYSIPYSTGPFARTKKKLKKRK